MSNASSITSIEFDAKYIALLNTDAKSIDIAVKSSVEMEPAYSVIPMSSATADPNVETTSMALLALWTLHADRPSQGQK